ncbi:hypothetical protein ACJO1P_20230 [Vibrio parahaemolyticus]|uniref:hypothetical protein n=1 Tax=Vibrio TaxID=662 RepID=UPI000E32909E|nr:MULTISPECIES: hypothetical protein [Vibrio]MDW1965796.1 hypothetical protein [Vibrio sp. Vb0587]RFD38017.1 hypothetical protein BS585_14385 [Vibrio parahaemolyticus]HAT8520675.1 hypothetical protein [Vibrio vulnificus]
MKNQRVRQGSQNCDIVTPLLTYAVIDTNGYLLATSNLEKALSAFHDEPVDNEFILLLESADLHEMNSEDEVYALDEDGQINFEGTVEQFKYHIENIDFARGKRNIKLSTHTKKQERRE